MTLLSGNSIDCVMFEACVEGDVLYAFVTNLLRGIVSGCGDVLKKT